MKKLHLPGRDLFKIGGRRKTRELNPQSEGTDDGFSTFESDGASSVDRASMMEASSDRDREPSPPMGILKRTAPVQRTKSFSPWIDGDFFICISVKEGIDLYPSVPMRPATCDSFVRVTLQRPGAVPFEEAETRVLVRNCYPMWEECLPFPLNNIPDDTLIILRVLDKDIGHFNSFLGIVSMPIKDALAEVEALGREKIYRMPLLDRQGANRKKGEVVFGISVVAQAEYKEMRAVITSIQDPDQVHDCLRDYCLHLKVHAIQELAGLSSTALNSLKAEVSICSFEARRPLVGKLLIGGVELDDVELVVPLGSAFHDGDTLKGKTRAQFGEVKIDLLCGKTRIAKTQVPIWDVPFRPEAAATTGSGEGPEGEGVEGEDGEPEAERPADAEGATLERKTFLCNLTNNIANAVAGAGAALGRPSEGALNPVSGQRSIDVSVGSVGKPPQDACASSAVAQPGSPNATSSDHPLAPAAPLWDGRRYVRRMERMDRQLTKPPVIVLSMQLVKAVSGGADDLVRASGYSETANGHSVDFEAADADSPAEPLAVPPPLGIPIADFVVCAGPHAVVKAIFAEGAEMGERIMNAEKMTERTVSPWGPDPEGKALAYRTLQYMKPTVVGPTPVQATQKFIVKSDAGFIIQQYVIPHVPPAGQCVKVEVQVVGQHAGPNKTRISVTCTMHWMKTGMVVNMIKGKVEEGTPKDTRKYYETFRDELASKFGIDGPAAGMRGSDADGAGAAVAAGGAAAPYTAASSGGLPGGLSIASLAVLGPLALVVFIMLIVLMRLVSELGRNQKALNGLAGELRAVSGALASLGERLQLQLPSPSAPADAAAAIAEQVCGK